MVTIRCCSFPRRKKKLTINYHRNKQLHPTTKPTSSSDSTSYRSTSTSTTVTTTSLASTDPDGKKSSTDIFTSLNFYSTPSNGSAESTSSSSRKSSCPLMSCSSSRKLINNLRVFTFDELKTATKSFSRSLMIGEGGFGSVYRGVMKIKSFDGSVKKVEIAVKQLSRRGLQGHKEWVTEVCMLGVVDHPNLVKLIGYCAEDDERGIQRLLVYEFMPNRSVLDHLCSRFQAPLPWVIRLKIARDSAQGLAYLHEGMGFQIIFRDFKSSNILLDEEWNARLSDFGLARLGPQDGISHVSTMVVGTIGYAAPEYIQSGRLTSKCDVWSYGVFLYELMTGRRPLDLSRPKNEQNLIDWVKQQNLSAHGSSGARRMIEQLMDPRLGGDYSLKSAQRLVSVANRCLVRSPKARLKMSQVAEMVGSIVDEVAIGVVESPASTSQLLLMMSPMVGEVVGRKEDESATAKGEKMGLGRRSFGGENGSWLVCCSKGSST